MSNGQKLKKIYFYRDFKCFDPNLTFLFILARCFYKYDLAPFHKRTSWTEGGIGIF